MVSSEIVNEGKSNKIFRKTRKKYPKWTKRVVKVRRITKVIKGGKKLRFGAVVVIGNGNGQVGLGVGKADDVIEAVKKAVNDGKRELISIPLTKNYSIPYLVTGKYGAANVIIKPAVAGSGVLAGGSVRTVLELSGIQNISAKQLGCDNLLNNARATVVALKSIKNQNIFNKVN
jgi:small subunit ribosomal protein S5